MSKRNARLVIPFVLSAVACSTAQAQAQASSPTTQFTVGAKIWHAAWLSYMPGSYSGITAGGAPAVGDVVNSAEGGSHTDVLPQLAVRHGKYFASASHGRFSTDFNALTSPVITPTGQTLITPRSDHVKRRESDINIGYSITPEVGISIGYKDATETRDVSLGIAPQSTPLLRTKVRGYLIGAVGSFAVMEKLRLYAQAAYGPARLKADFYDRSAVLKTSGRYLIGEIGLSYPVYANAQGTGGATVAVGYRNQTVKTDSFDKVFQERRDLRDVRDGLVVSLNLTL